MEIKAFKSLGYTNIIHTQMVLFMFLDNLSENDVG